MKESWIKTCVLLQSIPFLHSNIYQIYSCYSGKCIRTYAKTLPNSTELSPSQKANSTTQEIPLILQNPSVHYRVYSSLLLVPILSQINLALTLIPYMHKICFDIILPFKSRSHVISSINEFTPQCCMHFFFYFSNMCYMPCPAPSPPFVIIL